MTTGLRDPRMADMPPLPAQDAAELRRVLEQLGLRLPRILLTAEEAAEALAMSPRRLWELTARGEIAVVRQGRSVRYRVEALREWAARHERRGPLHDHG